MKFVNKKSLLLTLIILISVMKFGLVGKGYLAFVDERRYLESFKAIESISNGNIQEGISHIFGTQGRPGDALLKLIPASLQYFTSSLTGMALHETANAYPLFIVNYIIFSLLLLVHYRFSKLFLKDVFLSLFSVLVLSSLVVSYISLRHADPYDGSLLILYFTLYKISKNLMNGTLSKPRLFGYGVLAFFGYLCYPGYILFYGIIAGILVLNCLNKSNFKTKIIDGIWFGAGSFACLAFFEIISRIVGESFLVSSYFLSINIKQGSFEECFSFIFKYLFEAEGSSGILLIIGLIGFITLGLLSIRKKYAAKNALIYILFSVTFLIFVAYASLGYFFEFVVFYARLIKQFIPLFVLFLVFGLQQLFFIYKSELFRKTFIAFVSCLLFFQFYSSLVDYKNISYPKDVAWEFYNKYHFTTFSEICEYDQSWSEMPEFDFTKKVKKSNTKLTFVNICGFYPFDENITFTPFHNKNLELLFSGKNCIDFKPYQFEGHDRNARKKIDNSVIDIKVYTEK